MKRRSFLQLLGLSPLAAKIVDTLRHSGGLMRVREAGPRVELDSIPHNPEKEWVAVVLRDQRYYIPVKPLIRAEDIVCN